MSKSFWFRRCKLVREEDHDMSYIPEEFAEEGKVLKVRDQEGWVVEEVLLISCTLQTLTQVCTHFRWTDRVSAL